MAAEHSVSSIPRPVVVKWVGLTPSEFHLVHHALRMLAKYPGIGEDGDAATRLADEMWTIHCETSLFTRDSGKPEGESWRSGLWRNRQ